MNRNFAPLLHTPSLLAVLALLLAACGGSETTKPAEETPSVVDRSISREEMQDIDTATAAESSGVDDDQLYGADELEDPSGPLSVRVLYFEYDSSQVKAEFQTVIEAHGRYLANNPTRTVTLEGHADERGSREYNLALGERRALAVRRQLVLYGASAGQIDTTSYGEERPAVDDHDESAYALNRRVEIRY